MAYQQGSGDRAGAGEGQAGPGRTDWSQIPVQYPGHSTYSSSSRPAYNAPVAYPGANFIASGDSMPSTSASQERREIRRRPSSPDHHKNGSSSEEDIGKRAFKFLKKSATSDEEGQSRGISDAKEEKLLSQKAQYKDAQRKLNDQLLKLKEQREDLKERGRKHEDEIMKENARLQKEVKNRIGQLNDLIVKIDDALEEGQCMSIKKMDRSPTEADMRSKKVNIAMEHSSRSLSPEEKEKRGGKKKKKRRNKSPSPSDDSDRDSKRKSRKRKKKKKASSSSSSDSESEEDRKRDKKRSKKDRLLAELNGKKNDETLMELLAKMSDAYMKSKQQNSELTHRVQALESENVLLKKQLQEQKKLAGQEVADDEHKEHDKRAHILQKAQELLDIPTSVADPPQELRSVSIKQSPYSVSRSGRSPSSEMSHDPQKRKSRFDRSSSKSPTRSHKYEKLREEPAAPDKSYGLPANKSKFDRSPSKSPVRSYKRDKRGDSQERSHTSSKRRSRFDRSNSRSPPRSDAHRKDRSSSQEKRQDPPKYRSKYDRSSSRSPVRSSERYSKHKDVSPQHRRYDPPKRRSRFDRSTSRSPIRSPERFSKQKEGLPSQERQYEPSKRRSRFDRSTSKSPSRGDKHYSQDTKSTSIERGFHPVRQEERPEAPSKLRDRSARINLNDWNSAPKSMDVDPSLTSLRQKMAEKEEQERIKEANRKRWTSSCAEPVVLQPEKVPEEPKIPEYASLPAERAQVSLQLTKFTKKVHDTGNAAKKSMPVIGKMPGRSKRSATPEVRGFNRLGSQPPSEETAAPPPPQKPTATQAAAMQAMYGGLTPEMYMQAINATMPTEPPAYEYDMPAMFAPKPPPKNPTPTSMNLDQILAAAREHMQKQQTISAQAQAAAAQPATTAEPSSGSTAIPLPPLPAAMDKDPDALLDTRPAKPPTPPPPKVVTEMDEMIEKHQTMDSAQQQIPFFEQPAIPPAATIDHMSYDDHNPSVATESSSKNNGNYSSHDATESKSISRRSWTREVERGKKSGSRSPSGSPCSRFRGRLASRSKRRSTSPTGIRRSRSRSRSRGRCRPRSRFRSRSRSGGREARSRYRSRSRSREYQRKSQNRSSSPLSGPCEAAFTRLRRDLEDLEALRRETDRERNTVLVMKAQIALAQLSNAANANPEPTAPNLPLPQPATASEEKLRPGNYLVATWEGVCQGTDTALSQYTQLGAWLPHGVSFMQAISPNEHTTRVRVNGIMVDSYRRNVALSNFLEFLEHGCKAVRPHYDGVLLLSHFQESIPCLLRQFRQARLMQRFERIVKGMGDLCSYIIQCHKERFAKACTDSSGKLDLALNKVYIHLFGFNFKPHNKPSQMLAKATYEVLERLLEAQPTYGNFYSNHIAPMTSKMMKNLANRRTLSERMELFEPLQQFVIKEITASNQITSQVSNEEDPLVSPAQIAQTLCRVLCDANLDFDKLLALHKEQGPQQLELQLRTCFLKQMVGQSRAVINQTVLTTKIMTNFFNQFGHLTLEQLLSLWASEVGDGDQGVPTAMHPRRCPSLPPNEHVVQVEAYACLARFLRCRLCGIPWSRELGDSDVPAQVKIRTDLMINVLLTSGITYETLVQQYREQSNTSEEYRRRLQSRLLRAYVAHGPVDYEFQQFLNGILDFCSEHLNAESQGGECTIPKST